MAGGPARKGLIADSIAQFRKENLLIRLSIFYSKISYPVNFGLENDDIGAENTNLWGVYQ